MLVKVATGINAIIIDPVIIESGVFNKKIECLLLTNMENYI